MIFANLRTKLETARTRIFEEKPSHGGEHINGTRQAAGARALASPRTARAAKKTDARDQRSRRLRRRRITRGMWKAKTAVVDCYEVSWLTRRNNGTQVSGRGEGLAGASVGTNAGAQAAYGESRRARTSEGWRTSAPLTISLFHNWSICGLTVMRISIKGTGKTRRRRLRNSPRYGASPSSVSVRV